jgi:hypothetical protein
MPVRSSIQAASTPAGAATSAPGRPAERPAEESVYRGS